MYFALPIRPPTACRGPKPIDVEGALRGLTALTKSLPAPAHAKHREVMLGHAPFTSFAARALYSVHGGL